MQPLPVGTYVSTKSKAYGERVGRIAVIHREHFPTHIYIEYGITFTKGGSLCWFSPTEINAISDNYDGPSLQFGP